MVKSLGLFWIAYRKVSLPTQKKRLRSFLLAFSVAYLGSVDYLPAYGVALYPFGYLPVLIFVIITARAIWRYGLVSITPAFAATHILDNMADALIVVDGDGIIRLANRPACDLLGTGGGELVGMTLATARSDVFTPEPFEKMISEDRTRNYEVVLTQRFGSRITLNVLTSLVKDRSKRVVAICYMARDITDRKSAEAALLKRTRELARSEAEREQLELFAYITSHDLQEPLQKILAFGDLLKETCAQSLSDKGKDYVDRMQRAATRMSRLIQDLLRFSRVAAKPDPFVPVNLTEVLREVLDDLELRIEQSGVKIHVGALPTLAG